MSSGPRTPMTLEDRLAADVFRKSYREYLILKPTHYRWSVLAPQSVGHLREALEKHWSVEKIADFLHCEPEEAEGCRRRYIVSKKVNDKETTAAKIRQAFSEWIGGVMELDEKGRENFAGELSRIVANQLYAAALSKEEMLKLSLELEGTEAKPAQPPAAKDDKPSPWGPQWKD